MKVLVVLGHDLEHSPIVSQKRLDKAIEIFNEESEKPLIFVMGGPGSNNVVEADEMRDYLLEKGIKDDFIQRERKSKNTLEQVLYIRKALDRKRRKKIGTVPELCFVTSDLHAPRVRLIADSLLSSYTWKVEESEFGDSEKEHAFREKEEKSCKDVERWKRVIDRLPNKIKVPIAEVILSLREKGMVGYGHESERTIRRV